MDPINGVKLYRYIQILEWLQHGIVLMQWLTISDGDLYGNQPHVMTVRNISWAVTLGISFYFPMAAGQRRKLIFIIINTLAIMMPYFWGIGTAILPYTLLAKSCLLLGFSAGIWLAIIQGIMMIVALIVSVPNVMKYYVANLATYNANAVNNQDQILWSSLASNAGIHTTASGFVIIFFLVLFREYQSRQRAERLAIELESMAANLERERIAREIHDSLGHSLMALQVQLELSECLHLTEPQQASKSLHLANQLARQCIADVRKSVQGIRTHFDLARSLQQLLDQIQEYPGFKIKSDLRLPEHLPNQVGQQLYCIVQEGLTNIQKHAAAQYVQLSSDYNEEYLWLELEDDGQGFVDRHDRQQGFGLRGMNERVQLMGGKLEIDSAIDRGTKIKVVIPHDPTAISR
jgi:signal transduction histidine kinase